MRIAELLAEDIMRQAFYGGRISIGWDEMRKGTAALIELDRRATRAEVVAVFDKYARHDPHSGDMSAVIYCTDALRADLAALDKGTS